MKSKTKLYLTITSIFFVMLWKITTLSYENTKLNRQVDSLAIVKTDYKQKLDSVLIHTKKLEKISEINDKEKISKKELNLLIKHNIPNIVSTFKRNFNYKVDTIDLEAYTTGIIILESKLNTNSVNSETGAKGLGQMLPSTKRIVEKKILRKNLGIITPSKAVLLTMAYLTYNKINYRTWDRATLAYLSGSPKLTGFSRDYLATVKRNFKNAGKTIP